MRDFRLKNSLERERERERESRDGSGYINDTNTSFLRNFKRLITFDVIHELTQFFLHDLYIADMKVHCNFS